MGTNIFVDVNVCGLSTLYLLQASLKASREHKDVITLETLEWAKDKILMGRHLHIHLRDI